MTPKPSVVKITNDYEAWMRSLLPFVEERHLKSKHKQMAKTDSSAPFRFLRGTFYLWAHRIRETLPALVDTNVPTVVGVGDIHMRTSEPGEIKRAA